MFVLPVIAKANFERLKDHLDGNSQYLYVFQNISLTLGTASGDVFKYGNNGMTTETPLLLGSGSKWAASTAMLAMIHHAGADIDAPMSRYLSWWTTDEKDPRSRITMRHFLTMTSGMVTDGTDSKLDYSDMDARVQYSKKHGFSVWGACNGTHSECVRELYETSPALYPPGKYFMYGTLTFNFVAAAMESILQKNIGELLSEFFLKPVGMKGMWYPPEKPMLGASLFASAEDMGKFMRGVLTKSILPAKLHDEQEKIEETFEQYSTQNAGFGPYGMGLWGECISMGNRPFPEDCKAARRFAHPGCFGYWNYVNRRDGYYFNFLPRYTCDKSNQWCGSGHAPDPNEPESCPALGPAGYFRQDVENLVNDAMRAVVASETSAHLLI
jgi:CubicO group peptidase (beta-lactamase class C family)